MIATLGRITLAYDGTLAGLLTAALAYGATEGAVLVTREGRQRIVRHGRRLALVLD